MVTIMPHNRVFLSHRSPLRSTTVNTGVLGVCLWLASTPLHQVRAESTSGDVATLPELTVSGDSIPGSAGAGYREESAAIGVLGNQSLQNTPYSVDVYSRELMDNLQARSISDVTKLDASVSPSPGNLVGENNAVAIRGLQPGGTGQKLDGMTFRNRATDLPLEHIESVDILKGASGFLYGFGAPGGIINYTLKRPTEQPTRTLNLQLMDSGLPLVHGDLGGRFGANDQFGYRINAVHESGSTYINDGESRRKSASVALDWRITPDLVWQVDALKANHKRTGGDYGITTPNSNGESRNTELAAPLDAIRGGKRLAPKWTSYESIQETWGTDLNWQMSERWNLQLAHRQSDNYRLFHMPVLYANAEGDYSAYLYSYNNLFKSEQSQLKISGEAETGFVRHELVAGVSHTETVSSNSGPRNQFVDLGSGNLSDPEAFTEPFDRLPKNAAKIDEYSRVKRRELFLSDTLKVGPNWDLIIGARHGNLKDEFGDYDESEITPTLAVIHRPVEGLSLYASYIEAFEQGEVAPDTAANAGEVFDPLVSEQQELGIKVDRDNWSANAAIFQLQRGLSYTNSDNVFTQNGEARYEGVELSTKARLSAQWMLSASALWLDARNKQTGGANRDGERIQGVAREQFKLYGEYRVSDMPLTLTAGAQYVGDRPLDSQGRWEVDAFTLFDAGARYDVKPGGVPVTLRLNVENLTDEAYWLTASGSSYLYQGAPRTIKLGAQIEF